MGFVDFGSHDLLSVWTLSRYARAMDVDSCVSSPRNEGCIDNNV